MQRLADVQKVIVLAGGPSAEAEVSRVTAAGMAGALNALGVAHAVWELDGDWIDRLAREPRDGLFVLLGLHGSPGEDGRVQGVLDLMGLPYQGAGVMASAVAMDKIRSRVLFAAAGLDIADAVWGEDLADAARASAFLEQHGTVVVKPSEAGSSVGVSVVRQLSAMVAACEKAAMVGPYPAAQNPVLVEEFIPGLELTVGVLAGWDGCTGGVLGVIEIVPQGAGLYDYAAKYVSGGSTHVLPAKIPETLEKQLQVAAVAAGKALGVTGAYRVDFRYDELNGRAVVLEVNTLPGMTPTSLLPELAAYRGLDYPHLVGWMIEDGLKQWCLHRPYTLERCP